ncbi:MAG: helix-turn-helix domain-containing protein [Spirochaetia bacterium]|nr:helix-turn-helix domain-containing protein [Spirochaetia bacterium]
MIQSDVGLPRGILNPGLGSQNFNLTRKAPPEALGQWIEHFWMVDWDLRGCEPYLSQTLPHPSVHVVFEEGKSGVMGVVKGRFSTLLSEQGRVFAIKWRPGGFRGFVEFPIANITDQRLPVEQVFGSDGKLLETQILASEDLEEQIQLASGFFIERKPGPDANLTLTHQIMDLVLSYRNILRVEDLVNVTGMSKRNMQRLFHEYVGVNPKWVIKRARLHEAVERLATDPEISLLDLSNELGYFDQAHFIKDFKSLVGRSPLQYTKKETVDPIQ